MTGQELVQVVVFARWKDGECVYMGARKESDGRPVVIVNDGATMADAEFRAFFEREENREMAQSGALARLPMTMLAEWVQEAAS